ncbi:MAG: alkylation response protein AidB-like acyl-CoA dehydrogenase [Paracoccaceae bacterium]|jgi:alkylation response protein AidB-like acyl-CoA dehydrogenase
MDLTYSPAELVFQTEVRDWLATTLPQDVSQKVRCGRELSKQDMEGWHALLNARGWLAVSWPQSYGGTGWSPVQKHIFEEECCRACAPRIVPFGLLMLAPVLMQFGTEAQRATYLPRILDGTDWWCQGYSEPGAGSDLASLNTRAIRQDDSYIVNGQKAWTTLGQHANRIFCLVRTNTDGKPQQGISFLLVDLDTPGIEMRPIRLIEGGHEVNEVFFTDVKVPAENLVGQENDGWTIAKFLLTHERTNIAGVGFSIQAFEHLCDLARRSKPNGTRLIDDPLFAARLARIEIDLEAMKVTNLRMLFQAQKNGAPGPESSILKIKGTEIRQAINDLARRALGPAAALLPADDNTNNAALVPADHARNAARYFNNRKISIYGGSNEIQKNILTKALLGL